MTLESRNAEPMVQIGHQYEGLRKPEQARTRSKYQVSGAAPAGFWAGLWHGLICPITFVVSLFTPNVRIYEIHNKGRLYDFGFVLGISSAFGSSGHQATRVALQA